MTHYVIDHGNGAVTKTRDFEDVQDLQNLRQRLFDEHGLPLGTIYSAEEWESSGKAEAERIELAGQRTRIELEAAANKIALQHFGVGIEAIRALGFSRSLTDVGKTAVLLLKDFERIRDTTSITDKVAELYRSWPID